MYGTSFIVNLTGYILDALRATGSTLLNDLVSYWPLNEISGTRYDVVGTNDLTDNNTVGAVLRGPEGTVASFVVANSESLSASATHPPELTFAGWVRSDGYLQGGRTTWVKGGLLGVTYVGNHSDGRSFVHATLYDGISWNATGGWEGPGNTPAGWEFVAVTLNEPTKELKVFCNGVQRGTTATYAGIALDFAGTDGYGFGLASHSPTFQSADFRPLVGPHGVWSRILTAQEQTDLLAQGNGLRYADLPDDLKTGLVSWWELDEVSGVRYDSHGSNDLTDNNTVGCEYQGPLGVVASTVEANSEYLSSTSADFTPAGSFSASLWVYITSSDVCFFMGKEFTDPQSEWSLLTGAAGDLEGRFWGGGLTQAGPPAAGWAGRPNNWSAPNLNKWWLLTYVYDAIAHTVTMYLNDAAGTPASTGVRTLSELGGAFTLLGGARSTYDTNKAASAGFWTKALSGAEVAELFNNGAGLRYADLSDGLKTSLVSWWNLDEQSGVRYDSHGSNDLTDNNTVGSVINAGGAMDGAAASFVAANSEDLRITGSPLAADDTYTLSMWVNPTADAAAYRGVWNAGRCYTGIQLQRKTDGTCYYVFATYDGVWRYADGTGYIPDAGGWTHLLLTVEPGVAFTSYVNNVLLEQQPLGTPVALPSTYDFHIGRSEVAGNYMQGGIDEVAIWDRVLTADERAELYNLGRGKYYAFE